MTRAARHLTINTAAAAHGTRARYVGQKCRCADCTRANAAYYRDRQARARAAAEEVQPSGPPGAGTIIRAGRAHRVELCPGANGAPCVRGGAWLRGQRVCVACIERATVWNGLVPAAAARRHVLKLGRVGVGYKSVADAAGVAASLVRGVMSGQQLQLRAAVERKILGVDVEARAGGAKVPAKRMLHRIEQLLERGFTRGAIATLLGAKQPSLQLGKRARTTLEKVTAIEKLWRRVERGEVQPPAPAMVPSGESCDFLRDLVERGVSIGWLSEQLGFAIQLERPAPLMRRANAEAVAALRAELAALRVRRELGDLQLATSRPGAE